MIPFPSGVVATADSLNPHALFLNAGDAIDVPLFDELSFDGFLDGFVGLDPGFVGVRFDIPGGSPHFGWIEVEYVRDSDPDHLTIYGWGYETVSGVGIQAGAGITTNLPPPPPAIPEPNTLALLMLGAAGVYSWRRRQQKH